ncbi:MAG: glutamine--fructose-6-phosphate transaminase (isomerizing) [Conexivisphaerales archaeon]
MCGIIGILSDYPVGDYLIEGLKRLEYRGYDSAGIAVLQDHKIQVLRTVGAVNKLEQNYAASPFVGNVGIAHTRWATHGGVSEKNAHPHLSCKGDVAVIHNGIIQNYSELRQRLQNNGHIFRSDTDTEVAAHLLEDELGSGKSLLQAAIAIAKELRGEYALVFMLKDFPDKMIAIRKSSPLLIGVGQNENIVSSDALAFLDKTNKAIFLEDESIAIIGKKDIEVYTFSGQRRKLHAIELAAEFSLPDKESYEHFTIKEIHEQPEVIAKVLEQEPGSFTLFRKEIERAKRIFIVAAGSSFHASLLGRSYLSEYAGIYSDVVLASEYKSVAKWFDDDCLILCVSQSGETMDVIEAAKTAKQNGATVISIVNRSPSTLEKMSDAVVRLNIGAEVGVAATKSFTAQAFLFYAVAKGNMQAHDAVELKGAMTEVLRHEAMIAKLSDIISRSKDVYYLGRGLNYAIALEGALKLKELAYMHAEGLAAGELKHGPLALIEKGTPLFLINPEDDTYEETLSNGVEVKSRGGMLIGLSTKPSVHYDFFVRLPEVRREFYPIVESIPLQLLAYYSAKVLNKDVDRPRNLAKSVTVK